MSEPLPADLAEALDATGDRRGPFGAAVHYVAQVGSTNDVAARHAQLGAPEGFTVVALAQTAGRGRMGRAWYSPGEAGLYVSWICRDVRVAPLVTMAAGVAVAEGIRGATGLQVEIKWPNDIVSGGGGSPRRSRKLAGILAEASSSPEGLQYVVLGCGINLRPAPYPSSIAARASSLEAELGRPVDRGRVLAETLAAFNAAHRTLVEGNAAPLLDRWRALAPSAVGADVEYESATGRARGTTAGLAEDGALLVRTEGQLERVLAGEVLWL